MTARFIVQNPQQDEERFWQQHAALLSPHLRSELVICQHLLRALRTRTEPAAQAQACMIAFISVSTWLESDMRHRPPPIVRCTPLVVSHHCDSSYA